MTSSPSFLSKARTYRSLGGINLIRIASYRFLLKSGYYRRQSPCGHIDPTSQGPYFSLSTPANPAPKLDEVERAATLTLANDLLQGNTLAFGKHKLKVGSPPDWHKNPFSDLSVPAPDKHWSQIPDFSASFGEIKTVWELSRFEWAVQLAMAYRLTGKMRYLETLNSWLDDWDLNNPPNQGPNWKCGQETSIRVLHLLLAAAILNGGDILSLSPRILYFVEQHAKRIELTLPYALAQDNNHGTSEAAALFICGHLLLAQNASPAPAKRKIFSRWARKGRRNLEERMARLVMADGSFSQYSSTYHRVLLATLTQASLWSDILALKSFSAHYQRQAKRAFDWLWALTDPNSGDCPNLGGNDGANIFRLSWHEDYRDFRPSIAALAHQIGAPELAYGLPDPSTIWLSPLTENPATEEEPKEASAPVFASLSLPDGGFEKRVSANGRSWALLRTANQRFRPPHADFNHVDLWHQGRNILTDSGSYSYAKAPDGAAHDLKTAFAHNTVTFDGHDQMPALGRFLYGDWPVGKVTHAEDGSWVESAITYFDGNRHCRRLENRPDGTWVITDRLDGPFEQAALHWHLPEGEYVFDNKTLLKSDRLQLQVSTENASATEAVLAESLISPYYLDTQPCKLLKLHLKPMTKQPIIIQTTIQFND